MERQSKLGIQISYCKIPTQSFPSMLLQIELQPRHIKKSEKMNFHDTMLQKTCRSITDVFISKDIPLYRMKLVLYLRINIVYLLHNQVFPICQCKIFRKHIYLKDYGNCRSAIVNEYSNRRKSNSYTRYKDKICSFDRMEKYTLVISFPDNPW